MTFQDQLLPFSFNFRKVKATFPIFVGMCYLVKILKAEVQMAEEKVAEKNRAE
jgi:hypothetical protein